MLDADLAKLYGVATKRLNEQVRRNRSRFPEDFMFQLTAEEAAASRSQIATLKRGHNIKYLPHAFTEQGVAMLSSVLNSERAVEVNIASPTEEVGMKKTVKQVYPPGWDEKKIRAVIDHYDHQTDEEAAAEIEAADEAPGQTWMSVPTDMVPAIARLIEDHECKPANGRVPKRRPAKAASRQRRKPARRKRS